MAGESGCGTRLTVQHGTDIADGIPRKVATIYLQTSKNHRTPVAIEVRDGALSHTKMAVTWEAAEMLRRALNDILSERRDL